MSGDDLGVGPLGGHVGLAVDVQVDDREAQVPEVILGDAAVPVPGPRGVGSAVRVEGSVCGLVDRLVRAVLGGALLGDSHVATNRPVGAEALDVEFHAVGLAASVRVQDDGGLLEAVGDLVTNVARTGRQIVDDLAGLAGGVAGRTSSVLNLAGGIGGRVGRLVDGVAGGEHGEAEAETQQGADRFDPASLADGAASHDASLLLLGCGMSQMAANQPKYYNIFYNKAKFVPKYQKILSAVP